MSVAARRRRWCLLASSVLFMMVGVRPLAAQTPAISDAQALAAGRRLWKNECDGKTAGLTSWNAGENFASLGIGHYIWYPTAQRGPFEESFPELLKYLAAHGETLPTWLSSPAPCPWNTRDAFLHDVNGPRLTALRAFLAKTVALQARFSADRLQTALPKMLNTLPGEQRAAVERQFARVAASPNGVYALVDYVNFKGEGVLPTERYQGEGWGLLQVLAGMQSSPSEPPSSAATQDFAASAARVLTRRVALSPAQRGEARWLPGWKNRVRTYGSAN